MSTAKLTPDFRMNIAREMANWTIQFQGTLDVNDASGKVQPELLKLHDTLVSERVRNVRIEIQDVDYMNSSGLKGFMAWFLRAEQLGDSHYRIEVIYDADRSWQAVSLTPMERIAPRTVKMTPVQRTG